MSDIKLKVGDRVRNIRRNSGFNGRQGVVVQWRRGYEKMGSDYYHVRYDNGETGSYQRHRSSDSLERVDDLACDYIKLGEWNITKQAYNGVRLCMCYGATMRQALEANGCQYNAKMLDELRAYMIAQCDLYEGEGLSYEGGTPRGRLEIIMTSSLPEAPVTTTRCTLTKVRRNVITGKTQDEMVKELGHARGVEQFNNRALGKSTAQALGCIGEAMLNPGNPVTIACIDHARASGNPLCSTSWTTLNKHFAETVRSLIAKLGLKGITVNESKGVIVYDPIVTEEIYVETK